MNLICDNCTGIHKCNKYCVLHAGSNLVDFLNGISVIETHIGDMRDKRNKSDLDMIISGHIIEISGQPTYMLSDASLNINNEGKFDEFMGENLTVNDVLMQYLKSINASDTMVENSIKTLKKYNSNKIVPIPIKPGSICKINYKTKESKIQSRGKVNSIQWIINKDNGKLMCNLMCSVDKVIYENMVKVVKIPITEYGKTIRLSSIEDALYSHEIDRCLIQMNDIGFIKPIKLRDNNCSLVIDSKHLYIEKYNTSFIVGTWEKDKLNTDLVPSEIKSYKTYEKLNKAINYIEKHRKYILPYGFYNNNEIAV